MEELEKEEVKTEVEAKNNIKIKKFNGKKVATILLTGTILVGSLVGVGTYLKNETRIEPVNYEIIVQQEYEENDLQVINFFKQVRDYGVYVANCPEGTFIFGEDYEAYSTFATACHFIFDDFNLDKIINGYIGINPNTGEKYEISGGFSESMRNSISYNGESNIRFQDLSQKAQYEIIQITKEISNITSPKLANYHKPDTAKFLENADLLLLGGKEGFIHEKIKDSYLGDTPDDTSYYRYYTFLDMMIKSDGALKREFEEAGDIIEGWIDTIKTKTK